MEKYIFRFYFEIVDISDVNVQLSNVAELIDIAIEDIILNINRLLGLNHISRLISSICTSRISRIAI